MADLQRIEQFKKMAADDPSNELGHFSLGRAYMDAGMWHEAIAAFKRTLELNANLSKVYQLLAQSLLKVNQKEDAIAQLTTGVKTADARGDLMPRGDMIKMLQELGAPVPELQNRSSAPQLGEGQVLCRRCGLVKPKMARAPFSHAQGKMIHENICADCWREWIGMGTKVINEMRLPLADPQAQKIFDQHMLEFLNLQGMTPAKSD
jgi:Fe-S cluster biosynthesis and repair protein YggX